MVLSSKRRSIQSLRLRQSFLCLEISDICGGNERHLPWESFLIMRLRGGIINSGVNQVFIPSVRCKLKLQSK